MPMIKEAEAELVAAAKMRRPGRFQIEAAIQSVHAERAHTGRTEWTAIANFYDQLMQLAPSIGAAVARAAAHAEVHGPQAALALLDQIEPQAISYQPYWAVRAHLLQQLNRTEAAAEAFDRAIGLSEDAAVRNFLLERRQR
jgi:RNA polymerase sigma-70 factor (ECF subfamily)